MKSELAQKKPTAGALFSVSESRFNLRILFSAAILFCLSLMAVVNVAAQEDSFLPGPTRVVSTVPANGDGNPYGVAFVPSGFPAGGTINPGDVLVSNFNNAPTTNPPGGNLQGTGTTIVDVPPNAALSQFFPLSSVTTPTPTGLTTALNVLKGGFVLVGSFPSTDGTCSTATAGSIVVIDKSGNLLTQYTDTATQTVQGPWDSAVFDQGNKAKYFVANALTGNIVRYDLVITSGSPGSVTFNNPTVIATYPQECDPVTFFDSPTGLVYDSHKDVLYVASTVDNAVFAVSSAANRRDNAGKGKVVYEDPEHLHGALGLAMAPNGHLLVTNNDSGQLGFLDTNTPPAHPSELVEFTIEGEFVKQISIDPTPGGSFGLAVENLGHGTAKLAAVNDSVNLFLIWTLSAGE
jgi:hypothetical protein